MTQEEKNSLLTEAIGMLIKVYAINNANMKLTDKDLDIMESIISKYLDIMESIIDTYLGDENDRS